MRVGYVHAALFQIILLASAIFLAETIKSILKAAPFMIYRHPDILFLYTVEAPFVSGTIGG